jgi:hypothetical protein
MSIILSKTALQVLTVTLPVAALVISLFQTRRRKSEIVVAGISLAMIAGGLIVALH